VIHQARPQRKTVIHQAKPQRKPVIRQAKPKGQPVIRQAKHQSKPMIRKAVSTIKAPTSKRAAPGHVEPAAGKPAASKKAGRPEAVVRRHRNPTDYGVRTRTQYEAAMAYMKAQPPLTRSGQRSLSQLIAEDSEANHAEAYSTKRFQRARYERMKKQQGVAKDGEKVGQSGAMASTGCTRALVLGSGLVALLFLL
jgi:hypothetical protein